MPEQSEIATLTVNDQEFSDWETVWIQTNFTDSYSQFRFTCAEREPPANQFKPGDECRITLGNKTAITGVILVRQVAADENSHAVMLQGVSLTWFAGRGSVLSKTGRFDDMSFEQIAEKVLEPTGVKYKPVGKIDDKKFKMVQVHPGEKIFDFLERIGRERKIIIAADKEGKYLWVGEHDAENVGSLKEGVNIKSLQCVISQVANHSEYIIRASCPAHDDKKYREAAHQEARGKGGIKRYSPLLTPIEHPVWTDDEVVRRCEMEQMWHEGQEIQITAVVQGWFTESGDLWEAGKDVNFESKMCMINDVLKIQTVTFTQDSRSGSLTTLLCVSPWSLNGKKGFAIRGGPEKPKIDKSAPKDPQKYGVKKF
jgi:prophage tail gpP-like protein